MTAPNNGPESDRATDPRAGSEARRCGARFGNGFGERALAPIAATVAESSDWRGSRSRRETRRSENVLDSAGDHVGHVGALGKSGKLGRSSPERVHIVSARHEDTSKLHSERGRTKARVITTEDCQSSGMGGQPRRAQGRAPRGQAQPWAPQRTSHNDGRPTTPGERKCSGKSGQPTQPQGRADSQAQPHKPLGCARANHWSHNPSKLNIRPTL